MTSDEQHQFDNFRLTVEKQVKTIEDQDRLILSLYERLKSAWLVAHTVASASKNFPGTVKNASEQLDQIKKEMSEL